MNVFVLLHVNSHDDDSEDVKFIGVYSTHQNAIDAVRRLQAQPGFSQSIEGFHIDEYEIDKIVSRKVPIDGFGVGRNLASSSDVPVLDMVYKLTQYAGQPKMKFSESKSTLPGT